MTTGRRDGRTSLASDTSNLPSPFDNFETQKTKFAAKGLNTTDLVALLGAHTIGTAACQFISYRLYNYSGTGKPDPTINPVFLPILRRDCPQNGNGTKRVPLDRATPTRFDNAFYLEVATGFVVLESDQRLFSSMEGQIPVAQLALKFFGNDKFGKAMNKMGAIEVLTGTNGEIRSVCNVTN
ncbi:Peroxidase superfamily protein [Striga hermonthica]|uniref:peroxidase n=1 Tax=Striga hermonthica TaxID=68872 RepID=A0A9N7MLH2_STRHE|nr:Peroxidase superfamily protein [Striga hermonthica]